MKTRGRPAKKSHRGQETFYKGFLWCSRCKFPVSPCSFFKLKLGRKTRVFQPPWMTKERVPKQCSYCRLRMHISYAAHLALPLCKACLKTGCWLPLGHPGAVCIQPPVPWGRTTDLQHLRPRVVSCSPQVRSFRVRPLQRGRNH